MFEALKLLLCKLLRIPPEPTDPLGSASSVLVFRASINYYRYKLLKWFFGAFAGLLVAVAISGVLAFEASSSYQKGGGGVHALEFLIAAIVLTGGAVFKAAISFFLVRLDYEMRWYKLSDRSLRIREGVFSVREMTMTFVNIQNIEITQGPLQRLFKIHDLKVESAGGGGPALPRKGAQLDEASAPHIAWFRGVDNAKEIMDLMRERLKGVQDSGLGHPDEERRSESPASEGVARPVASPERVAALEKTLRELKALRSALECAFVN